MGRGGYIGGSTVFRIWGLPRSDPKENIKKDLKFLRKSLIQPKSEKKIKIVKQRLKKNIPKLARSKRNFNYLSGIIGEIKRNKYFDQDFIDYIFLLAKNATHKYRARSKAKRSKQRYDRYGPIP